MGTQKVCNISLFLLFISQFSHFTFSFKRTRGSVFFFSFSIALAFILCDMYHHRFALTPLAPVLFRAERIRIQPTNQHSIEMNLKNSKIRQKKVDRISIRYTLYYMPNHTVSIQIYIHIHSFPFQFQLCSKTTVNFTFEHISIWLSNVAHRWRSWIYNLLWFIFPNTKNKIL